MARGVGAKSGSKLHSAMLKGRVKQAARDKARKLEVILECLSELCTRTEACREARLDPNTLRRWIEEDSEIAQRVADAEAAPIKRARKTLLHCVELAEKDPAYQRSLSLLLKAKDNWIEADKASRQVEDPNEMARAVREALRQGTLSVTGEENGKSEK